MNRFIDTKTIVGIVAGALISIATTYWSFAKSGKELRAETACLRKLHIATLDALTNARNPNVRIIPSADWCGHTVQVSVPGPEASAIPR